MPVHLVALDGKSRIALDKAIILVGRHPECDIQLESRKISRRHCCIAQVNKHLVVRDLGSTNGIRINGTVLPEGILEDGDELTIGHLRYQVSFGDSSKGAVEAKAKPVRAPVRDLPIPQPAQDASEQSSVENGGDVMPATPMPMESAKSTPPPGDSGMFIPEGVDPDDPLIQSPRAKRRRADDWSI